MKKLSFKWPGSPSSYASGSEIADYAELCAWQKSAISIEKIAKQLGRLDDNDYSDGVPEDDFALNRPVEEAFAEIETRIKICEEDYPFSFAEHGNTIHLNLNYSNQKHTIYLFLLLATRLNMSDNKKHDEYDGTKLFEYLSAEVVREYFGNGAMSCVFNDLAANFEGKINRLCENIGEGMGFANRNQKNPKKIDDGLDIVVWKNFSDNCASKLMGFGQCKTGTDYFDSLSRIYPEKFCSKWMVNMPVVWPVRLFFVAEALSRINWYSTATDAGLLFDRCRVIDTGGNISNDVFSTILKWTLAAAKANELPYQILHRY